MYCGKHSAFAEVSWFWQTHVNYVNVALVVVYPHNDVAFEEFPRTTQPILNCFRADVR